MASSYSISTIFRGVDQITRPVRRMGRSVRSFSLSAERNLRRVDDITGKLSLSILKVGKNAAIGAVGLASLAIVGASAVNAQAMATENMAKAMGANIKTIEVVSGAIKGIGLDAEAVTDLFEEMNNKFGESAGLEELTPVTEALAIMGLEFHKLKDLSPDKQFRTITDALLKMKDATQAQAAADILFGAEANKIIGTLRQQGKSFADIENAHKMLTFRTERSRQGARDHALEQAKAGKIIASLGMEISGLIGLHLTPLIKKFNEFAIKNKELIGQSIDKFFAKVGNSIGDVSTILERSIGWFNELGATFEKAKEWAVIIFQSVAAFLAFSLALKSVVLVLTAINLIMAANPIVLAAMGIAAAAGLIFVAWEPITEFFNGMFSGIADTYDRTVGSISAKITSLGRAIGLIDDEVDAEIKASATITTNNVVTPQERISTEIKESRQDFNVNIRAEEGYTVSSVYGAPQLNLINSGN